MSWLLGGPFLELSFIMFEPSKLETVINKIQNVNVKIEVHNPPEYIQEFYDGYPYDEGDPNSVMVHQIALNLTVHTNRERSALLFVQKISSNLLSYSMCFYGDADDALEWNQPGVRNDELNEFINLLISLYRELKFSVGGLAIEEDMKALFDVNEEWPNKKFNLSNLRLEENLGKFQAILIDQTLKVKIPMQQYRQIDKSGVLIELH